MQFIYAQRSLLDCPLSVPLLLYLVISYMILPLPLTATLRVACSLPAIKDSCRVESAKLQQVMSPDLRPSLPAILPAPESAKSPLFYSMAPSSEHGALRGLRDLPTLNNENYRSWSITISTYLKSQRLWPIITGTRQPRSRANGAPDEDFDTDDAAIRTILLSRTSTLPPTMTGHRKSERKSA